MLHMVHGPKESHNQPHLTKASGSRGEQFSFFFFSCSNQVTSRTMSDPYQEFAKKAAKDLRDTQLDSLFNQLQNYLPKKGNVRLLLLGEWLHAQGMYRKLFLMNTFRISSRKVG